MSISASQSFGSVSTKFWKRSQPALLTRTSTAWVPSAALASSYFEMSNTSALPPTSRATRSAASRFRSATRMLDGSLANRLQIREPIAPPPPVTRTVLTEASFRPFVDYAPRLADRALDGADPHVGADADDGLDGVPQLGRGGGVALDDHREM